MGLPLNSIIQCTYLQRMFGQRILTVLAYRVSATSDLGISAEVAAFGARMALTVGAGRPLVGWRPLVCPDLLFDAVRVQALTPQRLAYHELPLTVAGTFDGTQQACNLAVSISKRTEVAGRRYQGRVQMAGAPAQEAVAGSWDGDYRALVNTGMGWLNDVQVVADGNGEYTPVIDHGTGNIPRYTDITSIAVQHTVRTMHRRTVGLGI